MVAWSRARARDDTVPVHLALAFLVLSLIGSEVIEQNKEFEITKISEYADGTMGNWSHHVTYILPQVQFAAKLCAVHCPPAPQGSHFLS